MIHPHNRTFKSILATPTAKHQFNPIRERFELYIVFTLLSHSLSEGGGGEGSADSTKKKGSTST